MSTSLAYRLTRLPRSRFTWRRIVIAGALVLLLHLVFFLGIAPYLDLGKTEMESRTEVVQISPQELNKIKQQMAKDKHLTPLLKQELHEEYKTKEAPKDAQMMAPFNQTVPKQMVAGAQSDAPLDGGGSHGKSATRQKQQTRPQEKLNLGKLGLGSKVPVMPRQTPQQEQQQDRSLAGPNGPPGPYRPRGMEAKDLERGDQNLLNAVESEYYSFFSRFEEPIIRNWYFLMRSSEAALQGELISRKIGNGAELPVTIEFVLDRAGNFQSIRVVESSSIQVLDWATKESIKKLGAIPNPPAGIFDGGEYFTHRMRFMVRITGEPITSTRPSVYW